MECAARPALDAVRAAARAAAEALARRGGAAAGAGPGAGGPARRRGRRARHRRAGADRGRPARPGPPRPDAAPRLARHAAAIAEDDADDPRLRRLVRGRPSSTAASPTPPSAATGSIRPSRWTAAVLAPAHGVLVTSATLADPATDDPFALAEMRTGAARLPDRPKTLRLASPFDYAANARALVVTDVGSDDPRQVAAAMRELFLAAGGGGARPVHRHPPAAAGLRADRRAAGRPGPAALRPARRPAGGRAPWSTSSAPRRTPACSAPTPCATGWTCRAASLRLLVFDRVPWPRPDILHKARRERFGGTALRRRHRPRPHRPGLRPPDPPRRRPGRLRHARRRRPHPPVLRPARGRGPASAWGWSRPSSRSPRT